MASADFPSHFEDFSRFADLGDGKLDAVEQVTCGSHHHIVPLISAERFSEVAEDGADYIKVRGIAAFAIEQTESVNDLKVVPIIAPSAGLEQASYLSLCADDVVAALAPTRTVVVPELFRGLIKSETKIVAGVLELVSTARPDTAYSALIVPMLYLALGGEDVATNMSAVLFDMLATKIGPTLSGTLDS